MPSRPPPRLRSNALVRESCFVPVQRIRCCLHGCNRKSCVKPRSSFLRTQADVSARRKSIVRVEGAGPKRNPGNPMTVEANPSQDTSCQRAKPFICASATATWAIFGPSKNKSVTLKSQILGPHNSIQLDLKNMFRTIQNFPKAVCLGVNMSPEAAASVDGPARLVAVPAVRYDNVDPGPYILESFTAGPCSRTRWMARAIVKRSSATDRS
jgi:hypothetical protein